MNTSHLTQIAVATSDEAPNPSLFPLEMPVSYDTASGVASRYGDLSWDMSSMSTDATTTYTLYFHGESDASTSDLTLLIREQQKALLWLHMDAGKTRAWVTLLNTNLALTIWCKAAARRGVDLYALLAHPDWVSEEAQRMNTNYVDLTSAALRTLWRHRHQLGAPINLQLQNLRETLNKEARSRPETLQTPLIPSRVYCAILAALGDQMSLIEQELDALSVEHKSTSIFKRLTQHQMALMLVVAAYSGMRVGEVSILPLENVLVEFEHMGSTHYELQGFTHKLHKGVKQKTTWITSYQGVRAVRLAQRIARLIKQQHHEPAKVGQQVLLFPSPRNPYRSMSSATVDRCLNIQREVLCPVIEPEDIEELDRLELSRGWTRDGIQVGKRWPLAFHQLRRSLAVYAHRSGMVSLPALKMQLQHITQEMSSYYSEGFSRAVNLVFDKKHFSHEWQASKTESSYFSYAFGVLFSDDTLLGQGAQRMAKTVESRSRLDTLRLFEENKLAYRETTLGGCVSTDVCETDPLEPIPYHCLETNCVSQVVFGKRLDHVIKHQEIVTATLEREEAGSVEHRLEARHLEVLLKASSRQKKGVQ